MTDARYPIQELLVTARRNQILDAATTVFAEKGFHRATIKDVARAAGIADGTIYTYFSSKTEVLLGMLNRLNESTEREMQFALGGIARSAHNADVRWLETRWRRIIVQRAGLYPQTYVTIKVNLRFEVAQAVPNRQESW